MQVWCDWQVTLSALEVRFSRRCAIQIDVYLYLRRLPTYLKNNIVQLSFVMVFKQDRSERDVMSLSREVILRTFDM